MSQYLMSQCPNQRLALIWDGAGYNRSEEVNTFLASINDGLAESDWKITCLRFAPNDPTQNPIRMMLSRPIQHHLVEPHSITRE